MVIQITVDHWYYNILGINLYVCVISFILSIGGRQFSMWVDGNLTSTSAPCGVPLFDPASGLPGVTEPPLPVVLSFVNH